MQLTYWTARVASLWRKPGKGEAMEESDTAIFHAQRGIEGDAASGKDSTRQVLVTSMASLSRLGVQMGELRENVVVEGLNVDRLRSGDLLRIGSALLRLTFPCETCGMLRPYADLDPSDAVGARGFLSVVVGRGQASRGDIVDCRPGEYEPLPHEPAQRLIWWIRRIPPGQVLTFGSLTRAAGLPSASARALPGKLSRFDAQDAPLHRVVPASRNRPLSHRQVRLLRSEGVRVQAAGTRTFAWPEWLWSDTLYEPPAKPLRTRLRSA